MGMEERRVVFKALVDYGVKDIELCMKAIDSIRAYNDEEAKEWLKEHCVNDKPYIEFYIDKVSVLEGILTTREYNAISKYAGMKGISTIEELCHSLDYKRIKLLRNIGTGSAVNIYRVIKGRYGIVLSGYDLYIKDIEKLGGTQDG